MRFLLILVIAVPVLMAFRTLGCLKDWVTLRQWANASNEGGAVVPALHEPLPPGVGRAEAALAAWRKLQLSALLTAAGVCFAVAAGVAIGWGLGWFG